MNFFSKFISLAVLMGGLSATTSNAEQIHFGNMKVKHVVYENGALSRRNLLILENRSGDISMFQLQCGLIILDLPHTRQTVEKIHGVRTSDFYCYTSKWFTKGLKVGDVVDLTIDATVMETRSSHGGLSKVFQLNDAIMQVPGEATARKISDNAIRIEPETSIVTCGE